MFLVTGAAGFIGSHLCEALVNKGVKIIGIDNFDDYYAKNIKLRNIKKIEKFILEADILDKEELERIFKEYNFIGVYHLAAIAGVRNSIKHPYKYFKINIEGTHNLLDLCIKFGVKKFVFASSSSVFGNYKYLPIDESHPKKPISFYGASKLACEHWVNNYSLYKQLKSVIIRPFTVYGPRQRPDEVFTKFANLIVSGKPLTVYGDGTQSRDFTYVLDVVRSFILAMEKGEGDYNIGSGRRVTVNELVELLSEEFSKHGFEIKKDFVEKQVGDVTHTHADISKAKKEIGYAPDYSIKQGVKNFTNWFLNLACQ